MATAVFSEALPVMQLWETILERKIETIVCEDNQATIQVVQRGYSQKLRHISRTHKVNLGSLAEVFQDSHTKLRYTESSKQCADIFTKALEPHAWDNAIGLLEMKT